MNDWIEWNGGERPVAEDIGVDLKFRNGETIDYTSRLLAGAWDWEHYGDTHDIVAYRVAS